jgi:sugar phosphate isomerase/epimerase
MISRRDFGKLAFASAATGARAASQSTIEGVRIGVSGYSFQTLPLDAAIAAMQRLGLSFGEVWFRHIEPKLTREALREWRLSVPLDEYRKVAEKYRAAGIEIVAMTFDFKEDFSDAELERGFEMTRALGTSRIASSTTFRVAERLLPLMEKYRTEVAFHGHTNAADPNQFAGPDSFRRVMRMSPYARINLDIGQFVAAGFDPVPFIREEHQNIPVMHIRDGDPRTGTKLAWGTGTTPIREVLQLLKRERYSIVADIEYDYNGARNPEAEIGKCFAWCREALGEPAPKNQ